MSRYGYIADPDERARFRARRKFRMDMEHNRIVSFEEGELKGRNEGRIEGEIKGKRDGKLEDAKNMLAGGLTTDRIVQFTGLTSEQVESLRIGG